MLYSSCFVEVKRWDRLTVNCVFSDRMEGTFGMRPAHTSTVSNSNRAIVENRNQVSYTFRAHCLP